MFKSEFAREFCRSDLARSLSNVALNTPQLEEEEEVVEVEMAGQEWGSHHHSTHSFKQILQMTEKTIGSLQTARRGSQAGLSSDPLARLELENHQLRRQLELLGRPRPGPDMDSKFSSLATEVVRLQNTVSQVMLDESTDWSNLTCYLCRWSRASCSTRVPPGSWSTSWSLCPASCRVPAPPGTTRTRTASTPSSAGGAATTPVSSGRRSISVSISLHTSKPESWTVWLLIFQNPDILILISVSTAAGPVTRAPARGRGRRRSQRQVRIRARVRARHTRTFSSTPSL